MSKKTFRAPATQRAASGAALPAAPNKKSNTAVFFRNPVNSAHPPRARFRGSSWAGRCNKACSICREGCRQRNAEPLSHQQISPALPGLLSAATKPPAASPSEARLSVFQTFL